MYTPLRRLRLPCWADVFMLRIGAANSLRAVMPAFEASRVSLAFGSPCPAALCLPTHRPRFLRGAVCCQGRQVQMPTSAVSRCGFSELVRRRSHGPAPSRRLRRNPGRVPRNHMYHAPASQTLQLVTVLADPIRVASALIEAVKARPSEPDMSVHRG